jgi:hypothetical protein
MTDHDWVRGADSMEETRETAQERDSPADQPSRDTARRERRHQRRATWAEVVVASGVNIPIVFDLLGFNLGKKGVHPLEIGGRALHGMDKEITPFGESSDDGLKGGRGRPGTSR